MRRTDARILQMCYGRFLWGAWLGSDGAGVPGKDRERTREPGEEEEQLLEPRAINHGFTSGGDGLTRIVGPKWGKLGARRRRASLT